MNRISVTDVPPDFIEVVQNNLQNGEQLQSTDIQTLLQEVFSVAVDRGLDEKEFELLLQFFRQANIGTSHKMKLLRNLVPSHEVPTRPMLSFMVWFIYNYKRNMSLKFSTCILQWIIGLLDNGFINPCVIDVFYFDFYFMLKFEGLQKYACKLICKLTKLHDVTMSNLLCITKYKDTCISTNQQFFWAVLNVFKGFKPRLVPEESYKRVNVEGTLSKLPQNMDSIIKCLKKKKDMNLVINDLGIFAGPLRPNPAVKAHQMSSLIPFPSYNVEGLDKMVACYPQSIEETFRRFKRVPIPQQIMSLLRDEKGFFLVMFSNIQIQRRMSSVLLSHLEGVLIECHMTASDDDIEFLLNQTYKLEMFMQQGLPCVSTFLSGYLLNWDGLDHRSQILKLIEWSSFKSYKELSSHVLRPLHMLFVSCDVTMKQQILQTVTNLIRNMYLADVERVSQNLPHPFMNTAPLWTQNPLEMLEPLVKWVEALIKVSFVLKPLDSSLLLQCIHFYEMMNILESRSHLPMWTIVSCNVVYHSLLNMTPNALNRVCRLFYKYHSSFLPMLHETQPDFYNMSLDKVNITTKYIKELINVLWDGQAFSKKEDGVLLKEIPEEALQKYYQQMDLDKIFDVTQNISFLPFIIKVKEDIGRDSLHSKQEYLAMLEFYVPDVAKFIEYFSFQLQ